MSDTSTAPTRLDVPGYEEVLRLDLGHTVAYLAIHATLGGRAFGGVRIREYADEEAALDDAKALAHAMSRKLALADILGGGAKTVMIRPPDEHRATCVRRLGETIQALGGRYCCGPDFGFTDADDATIRQATEFVAVPGMSASTAITVRAGMQAAAPDAAKVVIQGLGSVGMQLAELLRADGLEVVAADPHGTGTFEHIEPEQVYDEPADVFSPNAMGGVLDRNTVPRLKVKVVCGGANNPFASEQDALALHTRGILCVPDILANSGAAIVGASDALGEHDQVDARLHAVGPTVAEVLAESLERDLPPHLVAAERADVLIARRRAAERGA